jgi:hypothetical protein
MVYRTGCLGKLPNVEFLIAMASARLAILTTIYFLDKVFLLKHQNREQ